MKGKTFIIEHPCIYTSKNMLIEGGEYLYKEGSIRNRAIVEEVVENGEWLKLMLYIPDDKRRFEVSHLNGNYGYSGMWRIYDWNEDVKKETEEYNREKKEDVKNFKLSPKYTKAAYLNRLSEDYRTNILIHFNEVYECTELSERDYDMVWLAWILGEGLLDASDGFLIHAMEEVEFDQEDYEITFEDELSGGVNIDLLREYYSLDKLYEEVLK